MKILLDTCTFLWFANGSSRLSALATHLFNDPESEIYLSVVSAWEITLKHSAGKLDLPVPPNIFVTTRREINNISTLPLDEEAVFHTAKLPRIHLDPFDRALICQSIVHGMALLTPDEQIKKYPVRSLW